MFKNMENDFESKVINISSVKNDCGVPLSEGDINALFLGFVRLVRKNVKMQLEKELRQDFVEASKNFRQSLIDLNRVENLLKKEKEKNLFLKNKIEEEKKNFCFLLSKFESKKSNKIASK